MTTVETGATFDRIWVDSLDTGQVIDLETANHRYRIEYLGSQRARISGHPDICPEPTVIDFKGSTTDSGGFEPGVVARGTHLIFRRVDTHELVRPSMVTAINLHVRACSPSAKSQLKEGGEMKASLIGLFNCSGASFRWTESRVFSMNSARSIHSHQ